MICLVSRVVIVDVGYSYLDVAYRLQSAVSAARVRPMQTWHLCIGSWFQYKRQMHNMTQS